MSFDPFVIGENLIFYLEGEKTVFVKCDPIPVDFMSVAESSFISVVTKKVSLKIPPRRGPRPCPASRFVLRTRPRGGSTAGFTCRWR